MIFFAAFPFAVKNPQQLRHNLQLHHQPACALAIDPAIDQRLRHHRQSHIDALKIREQVGYLALRLAPSAHLRHRLFQHRAAFPLPACRCRQLPGMGMANVRPFLCRRFALRTTLAEHLAPPIIGVPCLRNSGSRWITVSVSLLNHFSRFPDHARCRRLRAIPAI